jgi:hypothetical protein
VGSAKRERKRAKKKVAGGTVPNAASAPTGGAAAATSEVAGVGTSRPARHPKPPPKVEVKQGDWWRLYGMTTPMPWLEPDEPDGGT